MKVVKKMREEKEEMIKEMESLIEILGLEEVSLEYLPFMARVM